MRKRIEDVARDKLLAAKQKMKQMNARGREDQAEGIHDKESYLSLAVYFGSCTIQSVR